MTEAFADFILKTNIHPGALRQIEEDRAAGRRLVLAGRVGDVDYFERFIEPMLDDSIRYVGSLRQPALSRLVGRSSCALVTPLWDEPFGLVIAETLATGTPVHAARKGRPVANVIYRDGTQIDTIYSVK